MRETVNSVLVFDVSVVIPTRNRPEMLRRSVASALAQNAANLEVVVVIDGEDILSERVLRDFEDARVQWVSLPSPVGAAEARNIGARVARGRFIALLDDDDEWLPDKLRRQLALAETSGSDAFVVTTQYLYRREGKRDEVWPGHLPKKNENLSEFLFSSAGGFQTSTYLCPRELLLKIPFESSLKRHQDWDWFLKLTELPGFEILVAEGPLSIYWVPAGRRSISGAADWKYSLEWVESVRARMTAKAYAAFLVRICLRGALLGQESRQVIIRLIQRVIGSGGLTPMLALHIVAGLMVSEGSRDKIRGWKRYLMTRGQSLEMSGGS